MSGRVEATQRVVDDPDAPQFRPPKPRSAYRDTKRWCRGKHGVEHQAQTQKTFQIGCGPGWGRVEWRCWHENVCRQCGKRLGFVSADDCPDRPR